MTTLQRLHDWTGWFLIGSNALVGIWATAAQYLVRLRTSVLWWAIGVAQVTVFVVAIIGALMVSREKRVLDDFHALYGFSTIVAVGILYSYRTSPFVKDKKYLLYGLGSLFIMGLGIRALYLS